MRSPSIPFAVVPGSEASSPPSVLARAVKYLRSALALAGLLAVYLLAQRIGMAKLADTLLSASKWLPVLIVLEGIRVSFDALATYWAYGKAASRLTKKDLIRAQIIGSGAASLLPGGRSSEEATKAALLTPIMGGAESVAAAATNQAATLVANGIVSLPCTWAAWVLTGRSPLTLLLLLHAVVLVGAGAGLRWGMQSQKLLQSVAKRFKRLASHVDKFCQATHSSGGIFPVKPIAALTLAKGVLLLEYALLAHAVGAVPSLLGVLFMEGLNLLSLAAGVIVPGQIGVSESPLSFFGKQ